MKIHNVHNDKVSAQHFQGNFKRNYMLTSLLYNPENTHGDLLSFYKNISIMKNVDDGRSYHLEEQKEDDYDLLRKSKIKLVCEGETYNVVLSSREVENLADINKWLKKDYSIKNDYSKKKIIDKILDTMA